jgi:hypothetical protein
MSNRFKNLIWQNVTEGPMTPALRAAAIVFLSEVGLLKLRRGRPWPRHRIYRVRKLSGLAISWKSREFRVVHKGYRIFHQSGKAEGWDGVATPARGVLAIVGYWKDDPDKKLYCYWVTWFLNSWFPAGDTDKWTHLRRMIVKVLTIPKLEKFIDELNEEIDFLEGGLGGGDTNSKPWDGKLSGMTQVYPTKRGSLDRGWEFGDIDVKFAGHTPKTGKGNQMQHEGLRFTQKI